jgi:predicted XRE-type DNA-binding protein
MGDEHWVPIVGYEGVYEISSTGNVRIRYVLGGQGRLGSWRLLKPVTDSDGYLFVNLCLNGKHTMHRIHHLVADAFLPEKCTTDRVVRHLNDVPSDNRACNLARGTYQDNAIDDVRNGGRTGSANGNAKLTEDIVREIRRLYATGEFSQRELARRFGVSQSVISRIVGRQIWKHIL